MGEGCGGRGGKSAELVGRDGPLPAWDCERVVLNIGKLGPRGGEYYLEAVANNVDDYYTGAGEAPGTWIGTGSKALGLVDTVDPAVLRELLAGHHPVTGEQLARPVRRPDPRGQVDARPLLRLLDAGGDDQVSSVGEGWAQFAVRQARRTGQLPVKMVTGLADHAGLDSDALAEAYPKGVLERAQRHAGKTVDRRVPAFDLTFRPPKSVSILWAIDEHGVRREVAEAHDAAVQAALSYMEEEAGWVRPGHAGAEAVRIDGFVAAAFRHRTARPVTITVDGEQIDVQDPLLHTHVLVANLAQASDDGKWRALDGTALYRHSKTAGTLYQAHLRHELTRRLGVEWGAITNGYADLAGVPRPVIDAFSLRRGQILERMQQLGSRSAAAAQAATLATRQVKPAPGGRDEEGLLHAGWAGRAARLGFTREHTAALLNRHELSEVSPQEAGRIFTELFGEHGLTKSSSTFTLREVVQGWANRLPDGAPVDLIRRLAAETVADHHGRAVPLHPVPVEGRQLEQRPAADDGRAAEADVEQSSSQGKRRADTLRGVPAASVSQEGRWSTPELLALERRVLDRAEESRGSGSAVADPDHVEEALRRRPSLSAEQAAMVRRLCGDGDGVAVVIGKAGAGKTFALDAARDAWQTPGRQVVGCARAARAALELHDGAGIPTSTIHQLLADLGRGRRGDPRSPWRLPADGVLVVDEAGMVGTRTLACLLDHAQRSGTKVVLVGDPYQLPELDAGGAFRALAARPGTIQLSENRRQREEWQRQALDELRDGDVTTAVYAFAAQQRIVLAATAEQARDRLVEDWWQSTIATPADAGQAVMIALRASDVADLNRRARTRMAAAGALTGPTLPAASRSTIEPVELQAVDRVVCLRNHRRLGVVNGTRGTVTAVDTNCGAVELELDDGRQVTLPAWYLRDGHVGHGYAITGHKAQGATVDRTFVLGSDELYREWGYVALSRHREDTRLYLVDSSSDPRGSRERLDEPCARHHANQTPEEEPLDRFAWALQRSRAQALAQQHLPEPGGPGPVGGRRAFDEHGGLSR